MTEVHEYETIEVLGKHLDNTHVLVGESGGLSAVYSHAMRSAAIDGLVRVATEHGSLYLDPEKFYYVLDPEVYA